MSVKDESDSLIDRSNLVASYTESNTVAIDVETDIQNDEPAVNLESVTFFRRYKGRILMCIASYLFSYMHLGTKFLGDLNISVHEMLLFRSVLTTVLAGLYIHYNKIEGGILANPEVRNVLLVRGIFGYFGLACFMVSVTNLHLGDSIALSFTIPIFMIVIAIFYLKEVWSKYDVISICLGAVGIIYITKPESIFGKPASLLVTFVESINWDVRTVGLACALLSTVLNAIGNVSIRVVGKRAHFMQVVLYFSFFPIIPSIVICYLDPTQFKIPTDLWTWWCLTFMSLSAFVGQMFFSKALQIDSVAKVTPLIFLQVIFAFINDFFLFNFTPQFTSVMGAVCVGLSVYTSTIGK